MIIQTNVLQLNDKRNEQSLSRNQNKNSLMPNKRERRFGHPIIVYQYVVFEQVMVHCWHCAAAVAQCSQNSAFP
jgi:hypothetical protein